MGFHRNEQPLGYTDSIDGQSIIGQLALDQLLILNLPVLANKIKTNHAVRKY
jgi:hypothetical protein